MPEPSSFGKIFSLLAEKGAPVAIALTATATVLAATMKFTEPLVEKFADLVTNNRRLVRQSFDARTANLMLRLSHDRPTPPAQRKLRRRQRHATQRLEEARVLWKSQKRSASWASFINGMLIAAQYLVGATLASSFIQKTLSPNLTGTLGVLVVVASTIQQRYTPEVTAATAKIRAARLRRIIVLSENDLVEASENGNGEDYQRISNMLSAAIVAIETSYAEATGPSRLPDIGKSMTEQGAPSRNSPNEELSELEEL
jgi:hypothetical protein